MFVPSDEVLATFDELADTLTSSEEEFLEVMTEFADLLEEEADFRRRGAAWAFARYRGRHTLVTAYALSFVLGVRAYEEDPALTRALALELFEAAEALEATHEGFWSNLCTALTGAVRRAGLLWADERLLRFIEAVVGVGGALACTSLIQLLSMFWCMDCRVYDTLGLAWHARLQQALWRLSARPEAWIQEDLAASRGELPPGGCFALVGMLEPVPVEGAPTPDLDDNLSDPEILCALDEFLLGDQRGPLWDAEVAASRLGADQREEALFGLLDRYAGRHSARSLRLFSFLLYLSACRGEAPGAVAAAAYELGEEGRRRGLLEAAAVANLLCALGRVSQAGVLWDAQGRAHERLCEVVEAGLSAAQAAPTGAWAALCALELLWLWLEGDGAAFRRGFDPAEQRRLRAAVSALEAPGGELLGHVLGRVRARL
jgi:hypothetical protein